MAVRKFEDEYKDSDGVRARAIGFIEMQIAETDIEAIDEMAQLRQDNLPVDAIARGFYPSIYRQSPRIAKAIVYQATSGYFTQAQVKRLKSENLKRSWAERKEEGRR